MEGTCCDEQHMIRLHLSVLRHDRGAFHNGQYIALHPLTGNIGPAGGAPLHSHLVDFVQEDNARVLCDLHSLLGHRVHIHQLGRFLLGKYLAGLGYSNLALLAGFRHQAADHVLQIVPHALKAGACKHAHHGFGLLLHIYLYGFFFQLPFVQALLHPIPARRILRLRRLLLFLLSRAKELAQRVLGLLRLGHEDIKDALHGQLLRFLLHSFHTLLAHHAHCGLGQVADDGFHIPAHIAHLGEFRGLDLDEGSLHQLGQTAGNLCFAHAGGADHQDILGNDFLLHGTGQLAAAPAVAQGNRHRALGLRLPDNVFIQFRDDFPGGLLIDANFGNLLFYLGHASSSTMMLWFV